MTHANSAFPKTMERLAKNLEGLTVDAEALERPLQRCDLARCGGTCCHDGVYLSGEEATVVRELAETAREEFKALGLDLPEKVVVYGSWRGRISGPKTATLPSPMREKVPGYPAHFPETRCAFLLPDARCGLQALATERGLSPWHYKPETCWMHPLSIVPGPDGKPRLTLHDADSDPQRYDDYDGFVCRTHCGRSCENGRPARETLREEIAVLEGLAGRGLAE
ncbi:MAG: hypothetical protein WD342_12120 [Verrucomicrobiales bacterium]